MKGRRGRQSGSRAVEGDDLRRVLTHAFSQVQDKSSCINSWATKIGGDLYWKHVDEFDQVLQPFLNAIFLEGKKNKHADKCLDLLTKCAVINAQSPQFTTESSMASAILSYCCITSGLKDSNVRSRSVELIGKLLTALQNAEGIELLDDVLHPDLHEEIKNALCRRASDTTISVRYQCAHALAALVQKEEVGGLSMLALQQLCLDENVIVRKCALKCSSMFPDVLIRHTRENDADFRILTLDLLTEGFHKVDANSRTKVLYEGLRDKNPDVRAQADVLFTNFWNSFNNNLFAFALKLDFVSSPEYFEYLVQKLLLNLNEASREDFHSLCSSISLKNLPGIVSLDDNLVLRFRLVSIAGKMIVKLSRSSQFMEVILPDLMDFVSALDLISSSERFSSEVLCSLIDITTLFNLSDATGVKKLLSIFEQIIMSTEGPQAKHSSNIIPIVTEKITAFGGIAFILSLVEKLDDKIESCQSAEIRRVVFQERSLLIRESLLVHIGKVDNRELSLILQSCREEEFKQILEHSEDLDVSSALKCLAIITFLKTDKQLARALLIKIESRITDMTCVSPNFWLQCYMDLCIFHGLLESDNESPLRFIQSILESNSKSPSELVGTVVEGVCKLIFLEKLPLQIIPEFLGKLFIMLVSPAISEKHSVKETIFVFFESARRKVDSQNPIITGSCLALIDTVVLFPSTEFDEICEDIMQYLSRIFDSEIADEEREFFSGSLTDNFCSLLVAINEFGHRELSVLKEKLERLIRKRETLSAACVEFMRRSESTAESPFFERLSQKMMKQESEASQSCLERLSFLHNSFSSYLQTNSAKFQNFSKSLANCPSPSSKKKVTKKGILHSVSTNKGNSTTRKTFKKKATKTKILYSDIEEHSEYEEKEKSPQDSYTKSSKKGIQDSESEYEEKSSAAKASRRNAPKKVAKGYGSRSSVVKNPQKAEVNRNPSTSSYLQENSSADDFESMDEEKE